jgi:hypothetical protein
MLARRVCLLAFLVAGCGADGMSPNPLPDLSVPDAPQACPPNTKECVNSTLARVCPADGSGWLSVPCLFDEMCDAGACTFTPTTTCTPGYGDCMNATTALRCKPDGKGYEAVTCPAKTTCSDGQCVGACTVGESVCLGVGAVSTCTDGFTLTTTTCMNGELCVRTQNSPIDKAACKPAGCMPADPECNLVCGNKAASATSTDPGYLSFCQESASGYQWVSVQCPAPSSCDPAGGACPQNRVQASCDQECAPGQQRCTSDASGSQTCGTNGKWPTSSTACQPTPGGEAQYCMLKPNEPGKIVCGDLVCAAGATGACDASGFRPCVNGKVQAGMPCASGVCKTTQTLPGPYSAGQCVVECQAGDSRCVGGAGSTTSQGCVNGAWGATQNCASGTCQGFENANGRPQTVCGVCSPGQHRCTNPSGNQDGGNNEAAIQACAANGTWGATANCSVGRCQDDPVSGDAACIADCIPNAKLCTGSASAAPAGEAHAGTDAEATCTAQGLRPSTNTACGAGTRCRKNTSGAALGCVQCVGSTHNESGLIDSRCTNAGGTADGNFTQSCGANNQWAGTPTACSGSNTCKDPTLNTQACGICGGIFPQSCRESTLTGNPFNGFVPGCAGAGQSPAASCGAVSDCCASACTGTSAAPATCSP